MMGKSEGIIAGETSRLPRKVDDILWYCNTEKMAHIKRTEMTIFGGMPSLGSKPGKNGDKAM